MIAKEQRLVTSSTLTGFLSTPLKDILFIKRTDIVKPHKVIQLHLPADVGA